MESATTLTGAEYSITAASINEARHLFKTAAARLLSVGEWNRLCHGLSAIFNLIDASGKSLNRKLKVRDRVFIDSRSLGRGTYIEVCRLVIFRKPSGKIESISIEGKPASEDPTPLLEIKRYNNVVTAIVHERLSRAGAGLSAIEWRTLFTRILAPPAPAHSD